MRDEGIDLAIDQSELPDRFPLPPDQRSDRHNAQFAETCFGESTRASRNAAVSVLGGSIYYPTKMV